MGQTHRLAQLVRLSDTTLNVADPSADVRGRKVVDSEGQEIGKVEDLFVDEQERKARFLRIAAGGFLGIGEHHFLMPVEAVARVEDDCVHISRNRDRLLDVPAYDPKLEDDTYYAGVYSWWGYQPFWSAAHAYPPPGMPAPVRPRSNNG